MVEYSPIIKPFCENIILTFINWLGLDVKRAVTLPGDSGFRFEKLLIKNFPRINITALEAFSDPFRVINKSLIRDPELYKTGLINLLHATEADFINEFDPKTEELINLLYLDFYSNFSGKIEFEGEKVISWKKYFPQGLLSRGDIHRAKNNWMSKKIAQVQGEGDVMFTTRWKKKISDVNLDFISSEYTRFMEVRYPVAGRQGPSMIFEGFIKSKDFKFQFSFDTTCLERYYDVDINTEGALIIKNKKIKLIAKEELQEIVSSIPSREILIRRK